MIVLYSCIFGGSDRLKRAPDGPDLCIVYTDDPALKGDGWTVVHTDDVQRPRRAARLRKMMPHVLLPHATTASVWVDGSIEIKDWPRLMSDVGDAEIACLPHPDRSDCYAEGETVIRLKIAPYDSAKQQIRDALDKYWNEGFRPTALSTTGLFYRKHTDRVAAFNELWRDELNAYGTNDQVHVDYCAWKARVPIRYLRGHYRRNDYAKYDKEDHHKRRQPQFLREADCRDYLA